MPNQPLCFAIPLRTAFPPSSCPTMTRRASINRAAGSDRPELLDAVIADADIPIVEVGSQWPGIRRSLSPSPSRLVAPEMPSLPCSSEARS
jgi:hypothetical protein